MQEPSHNVFLLEDRKVDADLIKRSVLRFLPNAVFTLARNEEEFLEKITWMNYDVMLADYRLPAYNGLDALLHVRAHYPDLPFIFVTGTLDNEVEAAQAILRGANGYVIKQDLSQLETQVMSAIRAAAEKNAAELERRKKIQRSKLLLQEAYELLSGAESFDRREEVLRLMKETELLEIG